MGRLNLKRLLLSMLEPPWRQPTPRNVDELVVQSGRWTFWLASWAWTLAGVALGALVAPTLLQWAGVSNTQYQDWIAIGVAVVSGFLVQVLAWSLFALIVMHTEGLWQRQGRVPGLLFVVLVVVSVALPIAGVGYGIYRYLTWIGASQRHVTIAFVGGLLVKVVLIPAIKSVVTGAGLRWFMRWLRGDTTKAKGA